MSDKKQCKVCLVTKSVKLFHKHKACRYGVSPTCKDCRNTASRERYVEYHDDMVVRYKSAYLKEAETNSGNWEWFFSKMISKSFRQDLSLPFMLDLLRKQGGCCALTGVPLTCVRGKGERTPTNASVDRIVAGGDYSEKNVRLVTVTANTMRMDMTDEQLVWWANQLVRFAKAKEVVEIVYAP